MKNYRIRYSDKHGDYVVDHMAASPISAIDWFHKHMQRTADRSPLDYKVTSMSLTYGESITGGGPQVESSFDLPKSPNPDVRIVKEPVNHETAAMDFLETTTGGKLAE